MFLLSQIEQLFSSETSTKNLTVGTIQLCTQARESHVLSLWKFSLDAVTVLPNIRHSGGNKPHKTVLITKSPVIAFGRTSHKAGKLHGLGQYSL